MNTLSTFDPRPAIRDRLPISNAAPGRRTSGTGPGRYIGRAGARASTRTSGTETGRCVGRAGRYGSLFTRARSSLIFWATMWAALS
jgi:hypothetical protein